MAQRNSRYYTTFRGLEVNADNGCIRFTTPTTSPTTTSGERLLYANSSDLLVFDNGTGTITLGATTSGSDALAISGGDITLTSGNIVLTSGNITLSSGGSQAAQVSVIATTAGAAITDGVEQVFVSGSTNGANGIVNLPTPTPGNIVWIYNGPTAYELRTSSAASIALNSGTGAAVESAIPANTLVRAVCVSATAWLASQFNSTAQETPVEIAA